MALDPLSASKAYLEAARAVQNAGKGSAAEEAGGPDFGAFLQNAIKDSVGAMNGAENQGMAAATGKSDIVNVVTAISAAESSLETVVAVRDQVISAYQEILRMPI
jgi:flagellar hook-basal body complex protein FliE